MGLSNELSCEEGSLSCCCNPHRCFQSEAWRLYFPALGSWVVWSILLPGYSSAPPTAALPVLVLQLLPCCESSLPQLPIFTPPTGLNECFFFNSLVVRLPYSLIFCQFWLFFVFKFVVVLLSVVRGGPVCLPTPPSWPEVKKHCF